MEATFQGAGQEEPTKPNENAICRDISIKGHNMASRERKTTARETSNTLKSQL
jgi:hypothetical protein